MAYSAAWDETAPIGSTTQAADIDLVFRNMKRDLRERLNESHVDFTTDPVRPKWKIIGASNVDASVGAATVETTLKTITVPANTLGANGILRITLGFLCTGTNNTKTVKVKLDGNIHGQIAIAAAGQINGHGQILICNRNATNSQVGSGQMTANLSTGEQHTTGNTTSAVDTTVAKDITITGETPNAGDDVTITHVLVEAMRAA